MTPLSHTEQHALAQLDQPAMLVQVESWAAVNSGSRNLPGLAQMARLLADAASSLPGEIAEVPAHPVTALDADGSEIQVAHGAHLVVRVRPEAPLRLLFTGHMDTVFPPEHSFQSTRWLEPGVLNGPGVADMKGGIAVLLAALHAVEAAGPTAAFGYDILFNSDEEVGSLSSAPLIAELARGKAAALTYEPSALPDGTLAGARPGSGNFAFHVTGRAAHAGRNPQDGRNALVAAADLALRLKAAHREDLTVNPARIAGGSPNNVVPDSAVLHVNLRPRDAAALADAQRLLEECCLAIATQHEVSIHRHGGFARPPKPVDPAAERLFALVQGAGASLGLSIDRKDSGGVCDGNNIAACGVPVVDTMGVRGGSIHSADEFLIVDSLVERAALSAVTILRIINQGGV